MKFQVMEALEPASPAGRGIPVTWLIRAQTLLERDARVQPISEIETSLVGNSGSFLMRVVSLEKTGDNKNNNNNNIANRQT